MIFLFFKTSDHKKPYKINTFGEKNQTDCDNQSGRKNTNIEWHAEKDKLYNKLQCLNNSSKNFYEGSNLLLNFCKEAPTRFLQGTSKTKRQILNLVCSNLYYKDGKVSIKLKSVFDYLLKNALYYKLGPVGFEPTTKGL